MTSSAKSSDKLSMPQPGGHLGFSSSLQWNEDPFQSETGVFNDVVNLRLESVFQTTFLSTLAFSTASLISNVLAVPNRVFDTRHDGT